MAANAVDVAKEGRGQTEAGVDTMPESGQDRHDHEETRTYRWPRTSSARMRAGLRSALKTDCSGFKFQNGGHSVRWFREHLVIDRVHLLWEGHLSLFEHSWECVKPANYQPLWPALENVDRAYRVHIGRNDNQPQARSHVQAMLTDGKVERAVRWVLDPQKGLERSLLRWDASSRGRVLLMRLALEGAWTWLLERWQEVMESSHEDGPEKWVSVLGRGAVLTGSLEMVEQHWPFVVQGLGTRSLAAQLGEAGSVELVQWILQRRSDVLSSMTLAMSTACSSGQLHLVEHLVSTHEHVARRVPRRHGTLWTARAGEAGHLHVVEYLIAQGAEPDETSCLHRATTDGHYPVVRYLHEKAGLSQVVHRLSQTLLFSKPGCLAMLEYCVQHFQYTPSAHDIVCAARAPNVRPDVLRFLAVQATQQVWDDAWPDNSNKTNLDVQDLLRAAARAVGRTCR